MTKNRLAILSALCTLFLLAVSCDKKVGKLPVDEPATGSTTSATGGVNTCDTITYTKHIKSIIDNNCVSCHKTGLENGSTNLETYDLVKLKGETGRIKQRVILDEPPNSMPSLLPKLPKKELDLIQCWLNNGMKQ